MKLLFWLVILFSFNSFAEIHYTCGSDSWNRLEFQGNMFFVEIELVCETSIDINTKDKIKSLMISRFQKASDVTQVHEVGERDNGTYIISNLKQSIEGRGDMNVKFEHFVESGNGSINTTSKSLDIQATGYSRFTKEIIRKRIISEVDGKIQFIFRDFNKIKKPWIVPSSIFERSAKKGLSSNTKKKVSFLMNYLDQHL